MTWRSLTAAVLAACVLGPATCPAAENPARQAPAKAAQPSIEYVPLDAPQGMSQAVIVQGLPLVHTRQLLPLDAAGKLVGEGSVDAQIEQVLTNLEAVLKDSGSGLDRLVRVHIYALAPATVTRVRELLSKRLAPAVRPAISAVQTPLPLRGALVALDAVAAGTDSGGTDSAGTDSGDTVVLKRCAAVAGDRNCADAAILPRGGVAYLSGVPDQGGLTESAVVRSMSKLMRTLGHLQLAPRHVVQVKIFLQPVTSADQVLREVQKFFPSQMAPPVIFVEWLASVPIEIEMVAQLPLSGEAAENVEYFTPPEFRPHHAFSRVALVRAARQIYISGQYARVRSRGEPQAKYVFEQLQEILTETGSDMRHLVKGTYYVCDDDAARWVDRVRPTVFDPDRPPAASKLMVHAVGMEGRTMTIDMIAVESGR
jgi:enamine deaminase RidA (YjgF/YER057c/UK114 family)